MGATAFIACVRQNKPENFINKNIQGPIAKLISTRPEKSGPVKIIIRLPADPLSLVPASEKANQLTLILEQQKSLIQQLSNISSDIKVIYTYKTILNGLYAVIPEDVASKVDAILPEGSHVEISTTIRRPETKTSSMANSSSHDSSSPQTFAATPNGIHGDLKERNSVKFIGGEKLHALGIKGQGVRVGIIDTGIDYTHAMLGGTGSAADYKKVDPNLPSEFFPNHKVVGGYDFVGTTYDAASPNPYLRIPKPDANPLDESGHGSHVAGTVAGLGDGLESYTGVAPEAQLYALKVFGKEGSTDDAIVIAALEFAADPDSNIETQNPLDVVNLSLGSPFGNPKLLYREAIANLNHLGTVVVASAGNSGNISYITGSPAVSDEALSVAASIDNMDHNWHFDASSFKLSDDNEIIAEMAEATFSKPLNTISNLSGKLVYVGKAKLITEEQAQLLKGNIALIDRGEVTFATKISNAFKAGAIAAVVINNVEGNPFTMGGESEKIDIPAIMIGLTPGKTIRKAVQAGTIVIANLKSDKKTSKPEIIDTLTDFSSRGPRSEDSIIKPEISAPGSNIISAKMGGGNEVVAMSGTSMAAPHMAGVIALLKQTHPQLTAQELKSLAMLTAKSINDAKGVVYPIALQGAGRVQVDAANNSSFTLVPAALSLGRNEVMVGKTLSKTLKIKNLESTPLELTLQSKLSPQLQLISPLSLSLKANEEADVEFVIRIKSPQSDTFDNELDGFILMTDQTKKVYSLPVLAMALKISQISASALKVHSSSEADSVGSLAQLTLKNTSPHAGLAFLFNLLGKDALKDDRGVKNRSLSTSCDLESVGYRTVTLEDKGVKKEFLQMALKLYNPLTTWNNCEFSVQIDANGDGIADQELAGANRSNTEGLGAGMGSLLLDANKARDLRREYEAKVAANTPNAILDFSSALLESMDALMINQSSLMIIQTPVASLKTIPGQNLKVKVGALSLETDSVEGNDFLNQDWIEMPLNAQAQTAFPIPESLLVNANSELKVSLTKGEGKAPLILYFPFNHASMTSASDQQSQILSTEFVE